MTDKEMNEYLKKLEKKYKSEVDGRENELEKLRKKEKELEHELDVLKKFIGGK